jgi:hypothetical protein
LGGVDLARHDRGAGLVGRRTPERNHVIATDCGFGLEAAREPSSRWHLRKVFRKLGIRSRREPAQRPASSEPAPDAFHRGATWRTSSM